MLTTFNGSNGKWPCAGLTLSGNILYGTTQEGGNLSLSYGNGDGTVFSVATSGGSPTTLLTFSGSNGQWPQAALMINGNTLYGTTAIGGANGDGTVFSVPQSGGNLTLLSSFNDSNGYYPMAGVTLSGGTLYGTTTGGGPNGDGTVFSLPLSGGSPTVLVSFNGSNGYAPYGGVTLGGSTLYGTTIIGGNLSLNNGSGFGTVFSLPLSGGSPTTLLTFSGTNGQRPVGNLTLDGTVLYGMTVAGGSSGKGSVLASASTAATSRVWFPSPAPPVRASVRVPPAV